ncbi:MAG TPA: WD40 repeat domain-containing protein [Nocardioides sp.]
MRRHLAVGALGLALALAGCTGDGDAGADDDGAATTTEDTTGDTTEDPTDGSTVEVPGQVLGAAAASVTPSSPTAGSVAVPCHDRLCVWDLGGGLVSDTWVAAGSDVTATAWSPDGATLAVAAAGPGSVLLLDGTTGEETTSIEVPGDVHALAFDPGGAQVAVGTDDGVTVLDVGPPEGSASTGATTTAITGEVVDLAYAPDGGRVAVAFATGAPAVHDAATYALLVTLGDAAAGHLSWDATGDGIVVGGPSGAALHRSADGEVLAASEDALGGAGVTDVAVEPGTDTVAVATDDRRVLLWRPGGETEELGRGVAATGALLWSGGLYGAAPDVVSKWRTPASPAAFDFDLPPFD